MKDKIRFLFTGSVTVFDRIVKREWTASTYATSARQAISNLKYRFRNEMDYERTIPLEFDGQMTANGGNIITVRRA